MKANLGEEETPQIAMEPMIDCVFLLLIFFLVAATIRKSHMELPIELPAGGEASMEQNPEMTTLKISVFPVGKENKTYRYVLRTFDEQMRDGDKASIPMGLDQFRRALRERGEANPNIDEQPVLLEADVTVPYGKVAEVLHFVELSGWKKVGMRTADSKFN